MTRRHGSIDIDELESLVKSGVRITELARSHGMSRRMMRRVLEQYGISLPLAKRRDPSLCAETPPSPEDAAASESSLDLSPWVAERAMAIREQNIAARRGESDATTRSKVSKWKKLLAQSR